MDHNAQIPANQAQPLILMDEAATLQAGAGLAKILQSGDCVLLHGDLGAGKTTFIRGLLRAALHNPHLDVPSPTFTLVQAYDADGLPFYHYDLYRLPDQNSEQDLTEIGFFDALNAGVALIEWPQRLGGNTPVDCLHIDFILQADDTRIMTWQGTGIWALRATQSLFAETIA